MKIYTKHGDTGETSLFGGQRVAKHLERVEAYGSVDELNAILGELLSLSELPANVEAICTQLQADLFVLGADLATPEAASDVAKSKVTRITTKDIETVESWIDTLDQELPELKTFILPGGSASGAKLHVARTVCRRAERAAVKCHQSDPLNGACIAYLNRLSDFFFVAARYVNHVAGAPETPWRPS
ncbi:MAG: cob(I)yrinic acid a,c-diamide adenosyltransferase [Balneolaceae bacterium]|nr:cob(I)yrinic acid a,c-diamide adenosyltransferase [Balneolaceae bacterium]MDR9446970.1 cob(I)yrinic acid a,c-diamide adenosyltransferase [Balneolaceae bacterium]